MRIAKFFTLTLPVSLLIVFSCSETEEKLTIIQGENSISSPELSSTSNNKSYEQIDRNAPGDPFTNPGNFREVTPVKWDGKSKLKSGVYYSVNNSELEKLAEVDEGVRDFVEFRKRSRANKDKQDKTKEDNQLSNN